MNRPGRHSWEDGVSLCHTSAFFYHSTGSDRKHTEIHRRARQQPQERKKTGSTKPDLTTAIGSPHTRDATGRNSMTGV